MGQNMYPTKSDPVKTGKYISRLRKKHDMTQLALAAALRVSHQAVSKWETGAALPDIDILLELANLFGVSIYNLILGSDKIYQAEDDIFSETIVNSVKASRDIPLLLETYEEMREEVIKDCVQALGVHDSEILLKLCSRLSSRRLMQINKTLRLFEIVSLIASQMDRNDITECICNIGITDAEIMQFINGKKIK